MILCPNCGSKYLKWYSGIRKINNIVDNRLSMHDIDVQFHLACENCSETVKIISGDEVAKILNEKT